MRPCLKGAGMWPERRTALKRGVKIIGNTEPPNFKCSLVTWSGPGAFFDGREWIIATTSFSDTRSGSSAGKDRLWWYDSIILRCSSVKGESSGVVRDSK